MIVRAASRDDARSVLDVYSPYVRDTAISFEEEPPSVNEMRRRMENSLVWLVAEDTTGIVGYTYATSFHPRPAYRWSAEVSIYLSEAIRGRGLGKRLLSELLGFLRSAGFVNAFAGTTLPNRASIALFESLGFWIIAHQEKVGFKLGDWHDVAWWQLRLREPSLPPPRLELLGR